jgi:hypothetical protein
MSTPEHGFLSVSFWGSWKNRKKFVKKFFRKILNNSKFPGTNPLFFRLRTRTWRSWLPALYWSWPAVGHSFGQLPPRISKFFGISANLTPFLVDTRHPFGQIQIRDVQTLQNAIWTSLTPKILKFFWILSFATFFWVDFFENIRNLTILSFLHPKFLHPRITQSLCKVSHKHLAFFFM